MNNIVKCFIRQQHKILSPQAIENIRTGVVFPGHVEDNYLPTNFEGKAPTVTVFGSTGFLGKYVLEELVKYGYQIILPYRGDVHDIKSTRMIGSPRQNLFLTFSLEDDAAIEKALRQSDLVVNLIGRDFENRHFSFEELHVERAAYIAKKAKMIGVRGLLHVSALTHSDSQGHLQTGGSAFLHSKAAGELAVRKEFPEAIIIRPASIWGLHDRFIFHFIGRHRRIRQRGVGGVSVPLWQLGRETVKQPVYAGDVARAIARLLQGAAEGRYRGQTAELLGPQRFQLDHLVTWFYLQLRHRLSDIHIVEMSDWFRFKSRWGHLVSAKYPLLTLDGLERECATERASGEEGLLTLHTLGIQAGRLEDRLQWLLKPHRGMGLFWDDLGGFDPPPAPPVAVW